MAAPPSLLRCAYHRQKDILSGSPSRVVKSQLSSANASSVGNEWGRGHQAHPRHEQEVVVEWPSTTRPQKFFGLLVTPWQVWPLTAQFSVAATAAHPPLGRKANILAHTLDDDLGLFNHADCITPVRSYWHRDQFW